MSTTPHTSSDAAHEMSDFNWTLVMWLIPVSVIILVGFTLICLYSFRGYKDAAVVASSDFQTTELNIQRAKENEILSQYKVLDKGKGRIQIPIARAMELAVADHQNAAGKEWKPITDTYLEGAPFAGRPVAPIVPVTGHEVSAPAAAIPAAKSVPDGISIEEAAPAAHEKKSH